MTQELSEERTEFAHHISGRPDFAFLTVKIPAEQTLKVEASAMASMDTTRRCGRG